MTGGKEAIIEAYFQARRKGLSATAAWDEAVDNATDAYCDWLTKAGASQAEITRTLTAAAERVKAKTERTQALAQFKGG